MLHSTLHSYYLQILLKTGPGLSHMIYSLYFLFFSHVCETLRWVSLGKPGLNVKVQLWHIIAGPSINRSVHFFLSGQLDYQQADRPDLLLQETSVSKQESIFQQVKEILFSCPQFAKTTKCLGHILHCKYYS